MENKGKKVFIKIDGKDIECDEGENLVKVAQMNGISIPTLCYFDHIDPALGTCRVCTVKINGKYVAGCQVKAKDRLEVEFNSEDLNNQRKAIVEILFAEGNHICPLCEKSGKCILQAEAYEMRMDRPRFHYTFPNRKIDYKPKNIIMEHHRCILCRRCVEDVFTDDGYRVFYYQQRGTETFVGVDYEQEAKLSCEQAKRAMEICPVGTILLKENTIDPIGNRMFDKHSIGELETQSLSSFPIENKTFPLVKEKKVIATTSLAGCFGCHMSMLDVDLGMYNLVEIIEFNKSPFTDIKVPTKRCHLALVEGGCCSDENVEVLKMLREHCDVLVSVGACAINGNLPALRNWLSLEDVMKDAYLESPTSDDNSIIPHHEDIPKMLNKVYPCHEVVKMDYFIPGCPPGADHIWKVVQNILFGTNYQVPYEEFKYD